MADLDLYSALKGYQIVPIIDISMSLTSGDPTFSKIFQSRNPGYAGFPPKTMWQSVQYGIHHLCDVLSSIDPDGLDVILFGEYIHVINGIVDGGSADRLLASVKLEKQTRTADAIEAAFKLHQKYKDQNFGHKGTIFFLITDGEPNGEKNERKDVRRVFKRIAEECADNPYQVGFQLLQVGVDKKAQQFLQELDDMHEKEEIPDIIDTKSWYDFLEGKETVLTLCHKALTD